MDSPPSDHNQSPDDEAQRALTALLDYEIGVSKEKAGRGAALAAILAYGLALLERRAKFPSDKEFGKWIAANGLDQSGPFRWQQERSAAMKIAEISTQGTTPVGSFSDCPYSTPTDIMKWWNRNPAADKKTAKPLPLDAPVRFSKAQEHHITARVEALVEQRLEQEFPKFQKQAEKVQKDEQFWRELYKSKEYHAIWVCCSPTGEPTLEYRQAAFGALQALAERLQLAPKKPPIPKGEP